MKLKAIAAAALAAPLVVACSSTEQASTVEPFKLNGAGATFPATLYNSMLYDFNKDTGNQVNYQAVGSGAGVRQFTAKTVDFGASDGAVSDAKQKLPMVHIPMTGGAIVPAYNLPGCDAKMTQTELADAFLGKITNWSHFGCEDRRITIVHRSDGSGTTKGFTNSLSAFSPEWKEKVGTGKSVKWPVGIGSKGNAGVAATLKSQLGGLGYVNYDYVKNGQLTQPALQNKAGNFVKASAETASAGLGEIVLDDQLRGADANPAGANAYPIVSLTWILAYPEYEKNEDVKTMLRYMLTPTQQQKADSLGYVPLPEALRQKALAAVETLK